MDLGSGIAIGAVAISAGGVLLKALPARFTKFNGTKFVYKELCNEKHSSIDQRLDRIETDIRDGFNQLNDKIDKL